MKHLLTLMALALFLLTSCEKAIIDDTPVTPDPQQQDITLTLNISSIEQIPFENTSRATTLSSLCTRINIAIFSGDTKLKTISQTSDQTEFGTTDITLQPGQYHLVVIAHNGKGNATITSPEKITFQNNKCTDTFYYYSTLDITQSGTLNLNLRRAVAMYRLTITDNTPSNVHQMQFFYTGGSSTFNAVTGFGCVNSRQTETFDVTTTGTPSEYEVYTFPHDTTGTLTMKVTALDNAGNPVCEQTYENLAIQINTVTHQTTTFFDTTPSSQSTNLSFTIDNDGQWSPNTINY